VRGSGIVEDDQHPFVPAKAGTQESEAVSFWVYILASRAWKLQLIERLNPSWKDLADELM